MLSQLLQTQKTGTLIVKNNKSSKLQFSNFQILSNDKLSLSPVSVSVSIGRIYNLYWTVMLKSQQFPKYRPAKGPFLKLLEGLVLILRLATRPPCLLSPADPPTCSSWKRFQKLGGTWPSLLPSLVLHFQKQGCIFEFPLEKTSQHHLFFPPFIQQWANMKWNLNVLIVLATIKILWKWFYMLRTRFIINICFLKHRGNLIWSLRRVYLFDCKNMNVYIYDIKHENEI